ncbi:MAG: hypothetical protein ACXWV0_10325 [Flavisolibacter sp.]
MSIRKNSTEHNLDDDSTNRPGDISSAERTGDDQPGTRDISSSTEEVEDDLDEELTEEDFEGEEEEEDEEEKA